MVIRLLDGWPYFKLSYEVVTTIWHGGSHFEFGILKRFIYYRKLQTGFKLSYF